MKTSFKLPSYINKKNGKLILSEKSITAFIMDWVVDQNIHLSFCRHSVHLYKLDRANVSIDKTVHQVYRLCRSGYETFTPIIDEVGYSQYIPWSIIDKQYQVVKQFFPGLHQIKDFFAELSAMNNHYNRYSFSKNVYYPSNLFDQYGVPI